MTAIRRALEFAAAKDPLALAAAVHAMGLALDSMEAHFYLGVVLLLQGKPADAAVCFRRATEIKPDFAEGHHNLAHCLLRQGDQTGAIAIFESLGFKAEALLRDQVKDKAGKKHDIVVLGHNPAEVQAQLEAYGLPDAVQH